MAEESHDTRIAIMEKQVIQIGGLFDKIDVTIEKLADVSNSIKQMLAIHEMRINNNEISHKAILNEFEKSRNKSIEQYDHILVNIAGIKEIFRQEILDLEKDMTNRIDILSKRTTLNEKWRWTMVGAGAVIIFIVEVLARSKVFPFLN